MPVKVDWADAEEQAILMTILGDWTAEEFLLAMQDFIAKADGAEANVELMVDMRQSNKPPENIMSLIRSTLRMKIPNKIEQVVVISPTSFWNRMFQMVERNYGDQITAPVTFVKTVDEAYDLLNAFSD